MGMFAALTAQERHTLARILLSGSRELIEEKMRLRRAGDAYARALYGTDTEAYVGAIDDVHGVLDELLAPGGPPADLQVRVETLMNKGYAGRPVPVPCGTGWPVA